MTERSGTRLLLFFLRLPEALAVLTPDLAELEPLFDELLFEELFFEELLLPEVLLPDELLPSLITSLLFAGLTFLISPLLGAASSLILAGVLVAKALGASSSETLSLLESLFSTGTSDVLLTAELLFGLGA